MSSWQRTPLHLRHTSTSLAHARTAVRERLAARQRARQLAWLKVEQQQQQQQKQRRLLSPSGVATSHYVHTPQPTAAHAAPSPTTIMSTPTPSTPAPAPPSYNVNAMPTPTPVVADTPPHRSSTAHQVDLMTPVSSASRHSHPPQRSPPFSHHSSVTAATPATQHSASPVTTPSASHYIHTDGQPTATPAVPTIAYIHTPHTTAASAVPTPHYIHTGRQPIATTATPATHYAHTLHNHNHNDNNASSVQATPAAVRAAEGTDSTPAPATLPPPTPCWTGPRAPYGSHTSPALSSPRRSRHSTAREVGALATAAAVRGLVKATWRRSHPSAASPQHALEFHTTSTQRMLDMDVAWAQRVNRWATAAAVPAAAAAITASTEGATAATATHVSSSSPPALLSPAQAFARACAHKLHSWATSSSGAASTATGTTTELLRRIAGLAFQFDAALGKHNQLAIPWHTSVRMVVRLHGGDWMRCCRVPVPHDATRHNYLPPVKHVLIRRNCNSANATWHLQVHRAPIVRAAIKHVA